MEGIDTLNSWKPELGHKTGNCGPQRPKRDQKSIGQSVCMYARTYEPPPEFRNHKSQSYGIRNLSSTLLIFTPLSFISIGLKFIHN